jgi:hypothetical protein
MAQNFGFCQQYHNIALLEKILKGNLKMPPKGDYNRIDDSGPSNNTSSDRRGGALKFLVRDAQKRIAQDQEVVRNELPGIKQQITTTGESAQTMRRNDDYSDPSIHALITDVNRVKTWIDNHKGALGISMQEYQNLRKGYRDARNTFERRQGTRFDGGSLFAGLDMSGLAASGMQITSREMNTMKRAVVDQAIPFLAQVDQRLRLSERQLQVGSTLDDRKSQHSSVDDGKSQHSSADISISLGLAAQRDDTNSQNNSTDGNSLGSVVQERIYDRPYSPPPER